MRVTKVKPSKSVAQHRAQPSKSSLKPAPAKATHKPLAKSSKPAARAVALAVTEKPAVKRGTAAPAVEPSPATLDGQIGFHLRRASQRMGTIFADAMGRYDLTPTQYSAIARIAEMGPMSQSRLERETALEPAELLNVVGRLVRRTLIRPRPSPLDPRLIQLELTAEALAILAEMKAANDAVNAKFAAPLSPAEATTLRELLERCG